MRVLIVGGGAREHALAWRLSQDAGVEVIGAPGNAGIAAIGRTIPVDPTDADQVVALAKQESADLVLVGPEAPLVAGVVDALRDNGIDAFGPDREAAQLEGSKIFSTEFMARHDIPTAGFAVFDDPDAATPDASQPTPDVTASSAPCSSPTASSAGRAASMRRLSAACASPWPTRAAAATTTSRPSRGATTIWR